MHSSWESKRLRWPAIFLGVSNILTIILGIILMFGANPPCRKGDIAPFLAIVLVSSLRIPAMLCTAFAQRAMATIIIDSQCETETRVVDAATLRHERRVFLCYHEVNTKRFFFIVLLLYLKYYLR